MTPVEIIGWLGTITGIALGLPQLVHLIRTRSIDGLSLHAWQAFLSMNIGWTVHGILIGQLPQILTSSLGLISTVPILVLMARQLHRGVFPTMLPGLIMASVMIGADLLFGSAVFGIVALVPALVSNAGQTVALVRSPHVDGVSIGFLLLAVLNQVWWNTWAWLVPDMGTAISSALIALISVFNLGWYIARRMGLRAFGHAPEDAVF